MLRVVLLSALLAVLATTSVQAVGLKSTQFPGGLNNYQPAYMLATLPSMYHAQLRERLSMPSGRGTNTMYPFTTHDNDFTDEFGMGSSLPSAQWDAEKQEFTTPRMGMPAQGPLHSMSLKRFYQSSNFPLSGTFMPLDLLHARHYAFWNPTTMSPNQIAAVGNYASANANNFAMHFGEDPNKTWR